MSNLFDLSGKTAIVTGGGGLIGEALSAGLAEHGARVIVVDTDESNGQRVADEIPGESQYYSTDIASESEVEDLMHSVHQDYGSLDVLVNAAYPRTDSYGQKYEDVTIQDWRENIDLHLNSYFLTSQTASLLMKDQESGGSIINLGSTYGTQAPDFAVYEGTDMTSPVEYSGIKGGVINMTRYLASYLGRYGVRANTLSPGGVFTDQRPEFVERYEERTCLKRMAEPEDYKGPIVFLASDASCYVTGQNLVVDGGWTIK